MGRLIIFHGSEFIVDSPIYKHNRSNSHNDYGYGFYCTQDLDMAKEWANRRTENGYANKYEFDDADLKVLDLCDKGKYSVLNWIAILLHNREISKEDKNEYKDVFDYLEKHYYIDTSQYDVVIGYRADDAYFRFPMMFVRNVLTLEKLEEIYLMGELGKQYVLISKKAFKRINFIKAIPSESINHERYIKRKDYADNSYRELELLERRTKGTRVFDLMRKEYDHD